MTSNPQAFYEWLGATKVSTTIQTVPWVIPTVQAIHILAIGIVLASMAMLDLRLIGLIDRERSVRLMADRFLPWVWRGFVVLALTGAMMIVGEPERELSNMLFWTKMILLVTVLCMTAPLQRILHDAPFRDMPPRRRTLVRAIGVGSLLIWVAIATCGRWIAYTNANA